MKTEALFFLHSARQCQDWTPSAGEQTPPVVFKYVMHYADGTTVEAPIRLGWGVDQWISTGPQAGKDDSVAWSSVFSLDGKEQAVAYQYVWTNPHSDVAITTVDLTYAGNNASYAIPVQLAISAVSAAK